MKNLTKFSQELHALIKKHNIMFLADVKLGNYHDYRNVTGFSLIEDKTFSGITEKGLFLTIDGEVIDNAPDMKEREKNAYTKKVNTSVFREFKNPVDGKEIASTRQLRDFERKHNLKAAGNDFLKTNQERIENDRSSGKPVYDPNLNRERF